MMTENQSNVLDLGSIGVVIAAMAGWLPQIASVLSIFWLIIRIIESPFFRAVVRSAFSYDIGPWLTTPTIVVEKVTPIKLDETKKLNEVNKPVPVKEKSE